MPHQHRPTPSNTPHPNHPHTTTLPALLAALALALTLTACATSHTSPAATVAVEVAHTPITTSTLNHWMGVLAPEHYVPDAPSFGGCVRRRETLEPEGVKAALLEECRRDYDALKQRTLGFLISSRWLTGEAREENLTPTAQEVSRRVASGPPPLVLSGGGASPPDTRLAVEAELASAKIRGALASREAPITEAQIAAYYHHHITHYQTPEQREIYIVEHVPSAGMARKIRSEVISGGKGELMRVGLRELVVEKHPVDGVPGKLALARAIFTAQPGVLSGLLLFDRLYAFFEVTHITQASVQPLAQVKGALRTELAGAQHKHALARLVSEWRAKWTARTDCRPGYVVQKCRGYRGSGKAGDPLALA